MKLKLIKVRLSFPDLAKPKQIGDSEPKYGASFLLDKKTDAAQIDALRAACLAVAKEKWPAKIPSGVKYCVHDGAEKSYAGYGPGIIYLSASNALPVPCVNEAVQPMDPRKLYAGCAVNVSLRLWAQDNAFGKRVNAQLNAVQFAGDGEAFGDKPVDPMEEFSPIGEPSQADPSGDVDTGLESSEVPF
jgi:hypothetical protein